MKTTILNFGMVALGVLLSVSANAFTGEAEIDGINYKIITKSKTAEVIQKSSGYSGDVVIPQTVVYEEITCEVTAINWSAFASCKDLTSVTIPNSVTSIASSAFKGCSGMTFVTIPNSVIFIGEAAFAGCEGLKSVTIPNSVTEISRNAFRDCENMESVTIGDGIEYVRESTFARCFNLTTIHLGSNVRSIGPYAFKDCNSLSALTIPNSVTEILYNAFENCENLTSLTIGDGIKKIGEKAFDGCTNLSVVNITDLTNWCGIEMKQNPTRYSHRLFLNGNEIKDLVIPESVNSISASAFSSLSNLASIIIPKSVTSIGVGAFAYCPELSDVYCYAEKIPQTDNNGYFIMESGVEYATLHVPAASISKYQNASGWKEFGKIVALTDVEMKKCETPTISYTKGKLTFNCSTSGASCVSTITDADIKTHNGNEIDLTVTYNISVYATATGYVNSDVATATLCWIDSNPKTEGVANNVQEIKAMPMLIQSNEGVFTISSEDGTEATPIKVYNTAGQMTTSTSMTDGIATLKTNMKSGEIAIVKIGEKSVKVVMK